MERMTGIRTLRLLLTILRVVLDIVRLVHN